MYPLQEISAKSVLLDIISLRKGNVFPAILSVKLIMYLASVLPALRDIPMEEVSVF